MAALPQVVVGDFLRLQPALEAAAAEFGLAYELLVAQTLQESSWRLGAYRYEPGFDRRYISSTKGRAVWARHPAWLAVGPTATEWFAAHPERLREQVAGRDWSFTAQTRIAASYGPCQLMFPTAVALGYLGPPEQLQNPESVRWGAKLLAFHVRAARARGLAEGDAVAVALARYNGGALGNDDPRQLRNIEYVRAIGRRFRQCWGRPLF